MALISLPVRKPGRRRDRKAVGLTGGDTPSVEPIQDPGLRIPPAFGQDVGKALSAFGDSVVESANIFARAQDNRVRASDRKQAALDRQIEALDKNRVSQLKVMVDSYAKRQSKEIEARPFLDEDGVEIDQQLWSMNNAKEFTKEQYKPIHDRITNPIFQEEANNYLESRFRNLKSDSLMRSRTGRIAHAESVLSVQAQELKDYVSTHPNYDANDVLQGEFDERIEAIKSQLKSMMGAGFTDLNRAELFGLTLNDELGQIQVDRRVELLSQDAGSHDSVQQIINDLRGGRYKIFPKNITKNIEKILKNSEKYFDDQQEKTEARSEAIVEKMTSAFYKNASQKLFDSLTDPVQIPAFDAKGKRLTNSQGKEITVEGDALITDPKEVVRMLKFLKGIKSEETDHLARSLVVDIESRQPIVGNLDENIELFRKNAMFAYRNGDLSPEGFNMVNDSIGKWEEESKTMLGRVLSVDKKDLAKTIKSAIEPALRFAIFGGKLDRDKVQLVDDLTRLGHARLDRAFEQNKAGEQYESFAEILQDIRNRIVDQGKDFLFDPNVIIDIEAKIVRGEPLTAVEAEQRLTINRLNRVLSDKKAKADKRALP